MAELREVTKAWIADLSNPEQTPREIAAWGLSWTDREDADAALAALRGMTFEEKKDDRLKDRVTKAIAAIEAAKAAGTWPEPSWGPFRSGPPAPPAGAPPAGGPTAGGGGPPSGR